MKFWIGFVVGSLFQATAGTLVGMNINHAFPWLTHLFVPS